jgi:membrane-bound ClpP family serine protease
VAVTALCPTGIVKVAGETWSAESLSGDLAVGATIHVAAVHGVRLDVWSENGAVPDHRVLSPGEPPEKEDRR